MRTPSTLQSNDRRRCVQRQSNADQNLSFKTPFSALLAAALIGSTCLATNAVAEAVCWTTPQPQTLEEVAKVLQNQQRRKVKRTISAVAVRPAVLALSSARLKTAYSAGLLVGWGETGTRPDFSVVTATGPSALIAPFAFLGAEGDQKIADIFTCEATSLQKLAERAASYLDAETLHKIALRHAAGARLKVALPGSAARAETVWDIGAIAVSGHPDAKRFIANILLASVDFTTFIDPATIPINAGARVPRNLTVFRQIGAGEPFLSTAIAAGENADIYLIHNGVLFPDESEAFIDATANVAEGPLYRPHQPVIPAYDFFRRARVSGSNVYLASPRPRLNIQPLSDFDMSFLKAMFLHAYRQGRMSEEWRRTFPDRGGSRNYDR